MSTQTADPADPWVPSPGDDVVVAFGGGEERGVVLDVQRTAFGWYATVRVPLDDAEGSEATSFASAIRNLRPVPTRAPAS